jgi:predicted alpha/beta superfamily hydrolase
MTNATEGAAMKGVADVPRVNIERQGMSSIAGSERIQIKSSVVGRTYVIDVARPLIPPPFMHSVPVIYVLDGNTLFALTCQIVRLLEGRSEGIPPAVVIGIGYPTEFSADGTLRRRALRVRDLTPTDNEMSTYRILGDAQRLPPSLNLRAGGSNKFREFIRTELQPFIESELQTDSLDQVLVGMSLGGLFALETLLSCPSLFSRWIAVSPSLWWDSRILLNAEASMEHGPKECPARVFLGIGDAEEPDMRLDALKLAEQLRSRHRGLELAYHQFPGESHQSVFPIAVSRGLRWVFENRPL